MEANIMGWGHWFGGMGGWGMLGGLVGLFFLFLVLAAFVVLIVWLWRRSEAGVPRMRAGEGSALEILERRYARGELTREEFEQMREDLGRSERQEK
ncbi:MAG: hypothetical protein A2Y73_02975 [Chloroflexi bacterium RBG_13_56_8]|nr:MAG: hypothetical protein A2Y73_02975 [Chloroflexi bacterium RBG_13_56_8]